MVINFPIRQDWQLQAISDLEKLTMWSGLWVLVHQGLSFFCCVILSQQN